MLITPLMPVWKNLVELLDTHSRQNPSPIGYGDSFTHDNDRVEFGCFLEAGPRREQAKWSHYHDDRLIGELTLSLQQTNEGGFAVVEKYLWKNEFGIRYYLVARQGHADLSFQLFYGVEEAVLRYGSETQADMSLHCEMDSQHQLGDKVESRILASRLRLEAAIKTGVSFRYGVEVHYSEKGLVITMDEKVRKAIDFPEGFNGVEVILPAFVVDRTCSLSDLLRVAESFFLRAAHTDGSVHTFGHVDF